MFSRIVHCGPHTSVLADLDVTCIVPVRDWMDTDLHSWIVDMWLGVEKATLRPDWWRYYARRFQLVQSKQ